MDVIIVALHVRIYRQALAWWLPRRRVRPRVVSAREAMVSRVTTHLMPLDQGPIRRATSAQSSIRIRQGCWDGRDTVQDKDAVRH
jgi:hypothetical protein